MAQHRPARHEFRSGALTEDTFRVLSFSGTEVVSQLFHFEVELISNDPDVEFSDVIGKKATLAMYRGDDPSEVNGIVVDFAQAEMVDGESEYKYRYRAVLAPHLWKLSLNFQSRIFQNLTVQEIVDSILGKAGVDVDFRLDGSYEAREYCTQYKETDLAFVQRLLEFEGIRYHFEHADKKDLLVITDNASGSTKLEEPAALQYRHAGGMISSDGVEAVEDFSARQHLITASTEIKDYNYRTPNEDLHTTSELDGDLAEGKESDFGIHVMTEKRGTALAKVRNEAIETTRLVMSGHSDCLRFRVGHTFNLNEHYRSGLNQTYMITRVVHSGSQSGEAALLGDQSAARDYRNEFTCVPASAPFRPPRLTPEPKLPGVLTAKVESGGGDYAPIDDQGRYRVRMPFDLGDAGNAQATKPVRLAQPYSGPEYGQHFPVHKDAEMVVACVDGNVDRILGLATIPNPNQASPVTSKNQTENTIRTAADNHIVLQDLKGSVGIDISTPTAASRIHLGAAEDSVQGIQSSTSATQTIHGGDGIFLKAGPGPPNDAILGASDIKSLGNWITAADGLMGVALAALGAGPLSATAFGAGLANAAGGTLMGLTLPGIYGFAQGGVLLGSPAGISQYAGAGGISLVSASGIDLAAGLLGVNVVAAVGGISLGAGVGDIHAATGRGDVKAETKVGDVRIEAHTGRLMGEAQKVVQLTSKNENIQFQAPDGNGDIKSFAGRDVMVEAKKNIVTDAGEEFVVKTGKDFTIFAGTHARIKAEDQLSLICGQAEIVLTKNGDITIKNSGNKIELKAAELSLNGSAAVKIKGGAATSVEGSASLDLKSSGVASLKGSLTQVG